MEKFKCCLCGKVVINSWGNSAWPLNNDVDARCCDECNFYRVIPARLTQMCRDVQTDLTTDNEAGD